METCIDAEGALRHRTGLIDAWSEFKPVAHICAALTEASAIACKFGGEVAKEIYGGAAFVSGLGRTLAVARDYYVFMTTFTPHGQRKPLVSPEASWNSPERTCPEGHPGQHRSVAAQGNGGIGALQGPQATLNRLVRPTGTSPPRCRMNCGGSPRLLDFRRSPEFAGAFEQRSRSHMDTSNRPLGRGEAAAFLTDKGYRTAPATLAKLACLGGGPIFRSFGRRPLCSRPTCSPPGRRPGVAGRAGLRPTKGRAMRRPKSTPPKIASSARPASSSPRPWQRQRQSLVRQRASRSPIRPALLRRRG